MVDGSNDAVELGRRLTTDVLEPMKRAFVNKDEIIDLMGVCLVAGENLFLLGPPGTAKSLLVHDLGRRLEGRTFEYLLTRFTEPNELFGPFDIRRLREGELVTNTEGMLPEASLVFLDELLNANSAILNSLLGALNERVFRRGRETRALPVLMTVGASNRLPEEEALNALFDRFLMRVPCENVQAARLGDVLDAGWLLDAGAAQQAPAMSIEDVRRVHRSLHAVKLADIHQPLIDLVIRLRQAGIPISDRRAVKLQRLIASSALLSGRTKAHISDLWVCRYIWDKVEQQEVLSAVVREVLVRAPAEKLDHPRSRGDESPDPESLARDLADIASRIAKPEIAADARANLRDRLGVLAARCQWVKDEQQRTALQQRVEGLWKTVGNNP